MNNKLSAAAAALALSMMLCGSAFADASDTGAPDPSPSSSLSVLTEDEGTPEKNDFRAWLGQGADMLHDELSQGWEIVTGTASVGWEIVTDAAKTGWDMTADAFETGWDYLATHIPEWTEAVEEYMEKHQVEKRVSDAWDTLKEGALHHGEIAMDKLTESYHIVKEWALDAGETVDREIADTVDLIAGAAGVEEALESGWYRQIETYMAEKADLVTDSVREAWETIKRNASEAGSVAEDTLREAYGEVRQWLEDMGEPEDSGIIQRLSGLEEA